MGCSICGKQKPPKQKIFTVIPSRIVRENNKSVNDLYLIDQIIGEGAHGRVYSCINRINNLKKVLKIVPKRTVKGTKTRFRFINEISQIKELDNENLLKMNEFFEDDKNYYLIVDYADGGEIVDFVIDNVMVCEDEVRRIMKQVFLALECLHLKNLVHREVNVENLLFSSLSHEVVKLVNIGTPVISGFSHALKSPHINFCTIPPEVHKNKYDQKSDMYSAGIVMYLLLLGQVPFSGETTESILSNQISQNFPKDQNWHNLSPDCQALIQSLLSPTIESRPSSSSILSDPWFTRPSTSSSLQNSSETIKSLKEYRAKVKLRKSIFSYIVNQILIETEEKELKQALKKAENNKTGQTELDDLIKAVKIVYGEKKSVDSIIKHFNDVNLDSQGKMDLQMFVDRIVSEEKKISSDRLEMCFMVYGKDATGKVFRDEISEVLEEYDVDSSAWNSVLEKIELSDGCMDFKEFKNLMVSVFE